ncbi:hypothetical protein JJV70_11800 [Streptomyces sp. JJ66]|uniref:hypothetical protein n=1 Tax=Streptomyces sp. JJ66 TaxID=2803843 RepID=UPI001C58C28C|nr:hypothetical protein [Streptomyces sp. JJ66]MBW1602780.1 hypothetical protein [Streptomyces sp. JJ66]
MKAGILKRIRLPIMVLCFGVLCASVAFLVGTNIGSQGKYQEVAFGSCPSVLGRYDANPIGDIAPPADSFLITESLRQSGDHYSATCEARAGGERALFAYVNFHRWGKENWDNYVTGNEPDSTRNRENLDVGIGGFSTPSLAGTFVPCTVSNYRGSGEVHGGMSVIVRSHGGGDHREELEFLVEKAATVASGAAMCEESGSEG